MTNARTSVSRRNEATTSARESRRHENRGGTAHRQYGVGLGEVFDRDPDRDAAMRMPALHAWISWIWFRFWMYISSLLVTETCV